MSRLFISGMSRLFISGIPPIIGICGIPGIGGMDIIPPPGIGPPDDIMVDEDEDEEDDLKLEVVDPSSDCVVAAILWLLALSAFLTEVPSSVTNAWLEAFMASDTSAPSGAVMTLGAATVSIPAPE